MAKFIYATYLEQGSEEATSFPSLVATIKKEAQSTVKLSNPENQAFISVIPLDDFKRLNVVDAGANIILISSDSEDTDYIIDEIRQVTITGTVEIKYKTSAGPVKHTFFTGIFEVFEGQDKETVFEQAKRLASGVQVSPDTMIDFVRGLHRKQKQIAHFYETLQLQMEVQIAALGYPVLIVTMIDGSAVPDAIADEIVDTFDLTLVGSVGRYLLIFADGRVNQEESAFEELHKTTLETADLAMVIGGQMTPEQLSDLRGIDMEVIEQDVAQVSEAWQHFLTDQEGGADFSKYAEEAGFDGEDEFMEFMTLMQTTPAMEEFNDILFGDDDKPKSGKKKPTSKK